MRSAALRDAHRPPSAMHIARVRTWGCRVMHVGGIKVMDGAAVMQQRCITDQPSFPAQDLCITAANAP